MCVSQRWEWKVFWPRLNCFLWPYPSQNSPESNHRAPRKLSTKQSRSKKDARVDSEVENACCEAWGVDFDDHLLSMWTSPSRKSGYIHRFPARRQLWGALGSDFGPYPSQDDPKSDPRTHQKLSTKQSRSKKYAGADSEVQKAKCEAWEVDFEDFELHGILPI